MSDMKVIKPCFLDGMYYKKGDVIENYQGPECSALVPLENAKEDAVRPVFPPAIPRKPKLDKAKAPL